MVDTTGNSKAGSLRKKIRLTTAALAFFIALGGFAAYIINHFAGNSFYAAFAPFLFLAVTVIFFGRWLSVEAVAPVEKVLLLAKSFERGVSTSLPKTSGSAETDELLESVVRLNYQIQKLIASMDQVAAGNLGVNFSPETTSDRIIQSFQKLLAKVSESIHAKQDLEKLRSSIADLSEEISPLKLGNLDAQVKIEIGEVSEISEVVRYLIERLSEIVLQINAGALQTREFTGETQKTIRTIIRQNESRVQEMTQASVTLKQVPNTVRTILAELGQSASAADKSIEKAQNGTQTARNNLAAVATLRHQTREAVKHVQSLNQRAQEINNIAKTIDDLAQRTTMVALNTSVQANELGKAGRGFVVVSEEIEHLAKRAVDMNKQVSSLYKTIQAEISEVENALTETVQEAANLSKFAIETGTIMDELEKYVAGFLNLQNRIVGYSAERTDETEAAFQVFVKGISETESSLVNLKEADTGIVKISAALEDLQSLAADFKIPSDAQTGITTDYPNQPLPEENISV